MSRGPRVDPVPYLHAVAVAMAQPSTPESLFQALDRAMAAAIGHTLFTVLVHHPESAESERRYTNQPAAYPVGGRKALVPSPWTEKIFRDRRPYLGRTAADIRAVFFDHELIASLGCASVLNLPVLHEGGRILGTVNLLHEEGWYEEADIPVGQIFAALTVPAFLRLAS